MINFNVNQRLGKKISLELWRRWLEKIAKTLKLKKKLELSIALVGDSEIKRLNKIYRRKNKVADVLSFAEIDSRAKLDLAPDYLGEIIIGYPQAVRQARRAKRLVNQQLEMLLIHGFLHLLGYDHQRAKDALLMENLEQRIINSR